MTSSLDSLTGMSLPAVHGSHDVGMQPNAAAAATAAAGGGSGFGRLMRLQQRGRELETKLAGAEATADAADPAATAEAKGDAATARAFRELRELVGPNPGGNARRAFAAILERLEGGGELKFTDRARLRLAIAADAKQVDLAGATRVRGAILGFDSAVEQLSKQTSDPTLAQDPARLAAFRSQMQHAQDAIGRLEELIAAGRFDQRSIDEVTTST